MTSQRVLECARSEARVLECARSQAALSDVRSRTGSTEPQRAVRGSGHAGERANAMINVRNSRITPSGCPPSPEEALSRPRCRAGPRRGVAGRSERFRSDSIAGDCRPQRKLSRALAPFEVVALDVVPVERLAEGRHAVVETAHPQMQLRVARRPTNLCVGSAQSRRATTHVAR